jgi:hypothetical protein
MMYSEVPILNIPLTLFFLLLLLSSTFPLSCVYFRYVLIQTL